MLILRIIFLLATLMLGACASQFAGSGVPGHFSPTADSASDPHLASTPATLSDYHLSPGDVLKISVFQVPDLTKEVQLDEAGLISLPLIGDIKAGGMSTHELQAEITKKLKAKYLQSPQVSVFLKNSAGQRVTVDGAVKTPGVYPINGQMTLVQALAHSGGITPLADSSAVIVFRQTAGRRMAAKFNIDEIEAGRAPDLNLLAGDTVVVDTSGARSVWQNVKETLPSLGVFAYLAAL